jgi:subfamily B ATP-binding cassette protein HlyB/CyaB
MPHNQKLPARFPARCGREWRVLPMTTSRILRYPSIVRSIDSGLACLVMLARFHGVAADPAQLQHEYCATSQHFELGQILLAAKKLGLKARQVKSSIERLPLVPLPAMALDVDGNYFVIAQVDGERVLIHDPRAERPQVVSQQELQARWLGKLVLFASRASLAGQLARFDFSWFIPAMVKYRKLLGEVLLMSFFLQLFALVSPLFFQVVMDKVLVHQGFTTLDVICIGLLVISVFEVLLGGVRTYLFAHTTNRIDVELGARLFRHLLALPLAYFEARRVGDSVARIRELENIRNFLTGQAMTSVLDLLFSVVFIAVMLFYSFWLTMIVVISLPCYFLISALITPILRARLNEKFNRGAENQAFLVESVNGIQTLKAMAVEPQATRHWDNQLAAYVSAGFPRGITGQLG